MPAIHADTRRAVWRAPHGVGSFEPIGKKIFLDEHMGARPNAPATWEDDEGGNAARIFVGFNVGPRPTYSVDDLIGLVTKLRKGKGKVPDASFVAQKGVYTSKFTGEEVTENGAQLVVIDMADTKEGAWYDEMLELAEDIAAAMQQEEVVLQLQRHGMIKKTLGVSPRAEKVKPLIPKRRRSR